MRMASSYPETRAGGTPPIEVVISVEYDDSNEQQSECEDAGNVVRVSVRNTGVPYNLSVITSSFEVVLRVHLCKDV